MIVDDDGCVADRVLAVRQAQGRDRVGHQRDSIRPEQLPCKPHHRRVDMQAVDDQAGDQRRFASVRRRAQARGR